MSHVGWCKKKSKRKKDDLDIDIPIRYMMRGLGRCSARNNHSTSDEIPQSFFRLLSFYPI